MQNYNILKIEINKPLSVKHEQWQGRFVSLDMSAHV